jgi:LPS O-antigen subunit length determinant protein (WzzB/FepE family)
MQQPINNPLCSQNDDEIDLRELWQKLVEGKWLIATIAMLSTVAAVVYTQFSTPIYEGKVSIEVGEVIANNMQNAIVANNMPRFLDNPADLSKILQDKLGISALLTKGTAKIIDISYQSPDKADIQTKLQSSLDFVQARHVEKAKLYQDVKISPTQQIAPISISEKPIKPKTNLIIAVAAVLGLMLGVFGVLVRGSFRRQPALSAHCSCK